MTQTARSPLDLTGKLVLVTGGTMGIGLAAAKRYAQAGAQTVLTFRWGSVEESALAQEFAKAGYLEPWILEADVSQAQDTERLLNAIAQRADGVDVFVSNVAFAPLIKDLAEYNRRGLQQAIDYSAWPMWSYTKAIHDTFGRYPKYVIGVSSDGPDNFFANYDFVAMSKAVLETMCRYLNQRLYSEGVRVNVVRSRMVPTDAFQSTFGGAFAEHIKELHFEDCYVSPEEVGDTIFALGSGLLDAIGGQVIMADRGFSFFDNLMGAYVRSRHYGRS